MLRHLQDNPDHGPIPDHCKDNNFEAWNFLVDITQKCSMSNKGKKFCDELTNLLHNVKILARVLFKSTKDQKNAVKIDRVLGNALDLTPGEYKFNENELHKDVTVLSLLENARFFEDTYLHNESNKACVPAQNTNNDSNISESFQEKPLNNTHYIQNNSMLTLHENKCNTNEVGIKTFSSETSESLQSNAYESNKTNDSAKVEKMNVDSSMSLHSDLLSDNSLLGGLPNLRTSVDDLILSGVDTGTCRTCWRIAGVQMK